jgi:hypothetical protein
MPFIIGDRILETSTSTTTGPITLAGAAGGYRTFASVVTANGDRFPYTILGGAEWEIGIGTRTSATTFTRATADVLASSNAGALVNLSAGTKEVWIDFPATMISQSLFSADNNIFINAACEVSQDNGTTAAVLTGGTTGSPTISYTVDNLKTQVVASGTLSAQQVSDAPAGFANSVKISVTVADASVTGNEYYVLRKPVEGLRMLGTSWGVAGAQTVSLGFWVKAHRIGTYTGALQNLALTRAYTFEYTVNVADTWEYKTITIAGPTSGVWPVDNTLGLMVTWAIAIDTAVYAQAAGTWQTVAANIFGTANQINGVQAVTDTFQITGMSLVQGIVAVPEAGSRYLMRRYDEELRLCQRLYYKLTASSANGPIGTGECYAAPSTASVWGAIWKHPVPMRIDPTVAFSGNQSTFNHFALYRTAQVSMTAMTLSADTQRGFLSDSTVGVGSSFAVGNAIIFLFANANGFIEHSARL